MGCGPMLGGPPIVYQPQGGFPPGGIPFNPGVSNPRPAPAQAPMTANAPRPPVVRAHAPDPPAAAPLPRRLPSPAELGVAPPPARLPSPAALGIGPPGPPR